MKNQLSLCIVLLFLNCSTKPTSHTSRQFEKVIKATSLSTDGFEIDILVRAFYVFNSKNTKLFDDKGYFVDKNDSIDIEVPIIRSAIRSYTGKYTTEELSKKTRKDMENDIYTSTQSVIRSITFEEVSIRFNAIFIEKVTIPEEPSN